MQSTGGRARREGFDVRERKDCRVALGKREISTGRYYVMRGGCHKRTCWRCGPEMAREILVHLLVKLWGKRAFVLRGSHAGRRTRDNIADRVARRGGGFVCITTKRGTTWLADVPLGTAADTSGNHPIRVLTARIVARILLRRATRVAWSASWRPPKPPKRNAEWGRAGTKDELEAAFRHAAELFWRDHRVWPRMGEEGVVPADLRDEFDLLLAASVEEARRAGKARRAEQGKPRKHHLPNLS